MPLPAKAPSSPAWGAGQLDALESPGGDGAGHAGAQQRVGIRVLGGAAVLGPRLYQYMCVYIYIYIYII